MSCLTQSGFLNKIFAELFEQHYYQESRSDLPAGKERENLRMGRKEMYWLSLFFYPLQKWNKTWLKLV